MYVCYRVPYMKDHTDSTDSVSKYVLLYAFIYVRVYVCTPIYICQAFIDEYEGIFLSNLLLVSSFLCTYVRMYDITQKRFFPL